VLRYGRPDRAVATSKTFRQLARIAGAAPSHEGASVSRTLSHPDVTMWAERLTSMTSAERAQLPGVSEGRAPQLPAGAIVADATMDLFGLETLEICPWALREGVTNVVRHSGARHAEVLLSRNNGQVHLELLDDGKGCDGCEPGNGLRGLRERVEARDGSLESGPRAEGGFRLAVTLPLKEAPRAAVRV